MRSSPHDGGERLGVERVDVPVLLDRGDPWVAREGPGLRVAHPHREALDGGLERAQHEAAVQAREKISGARDRARGVSKRDDVLTRHGLVWVDPRGRAPETPRRRPRRSH